MPIPSSVTQVLVTLLLIVPGFVFQGTRIRLRGVTAAEHEMTTRLLNAIAVSAIFALTYIVAFGSSLADPDQLHAQVIAHPRNYALLGLCAAFILPAIAAYVVVRVGASALWRRDPLALFSDRWTRVDPRPSAWDVAFQDISPCFVRIQMRDGTWLAGWFGERSYASSWPDPRSLFVQVNYEVDKDGTLGSAVEGSSGAVIDCTDATLIELLASPDQAESGTMESTEVSS